MSAFLDWALSQWSALDGPRFLLTSVSRSAVISVPHSHGSSSITHHPEFRPQGGRARQNPASPGTYTWPQRVRNGVVQHPGTQNSRRTWTAASGPPGAPGPAVAEAGADFPLSLLSTEPIPCTSGPRRSPKARACGRLVLLSCGGGRKSRPSCDRRLPCAQPRSRGAVRPRRPAWSKAGRYAAAFGGTPSARCPSLGWEAAAAWAHGARQTSPARRIEI